MDSQGTNLVDPACDDGGIEGDELREESWDDRSWWSSQGHPWCQSRDRTNVGLTLLLHQAIVRRRWRMRYVGSDDSGGGLWIHRWWVNYKPMMTLKLYADATILRTLSIIHVQVAACTKELTEL